MVTTLHLSGAAAARLRTAVCAQPVRVQAPTGTSAYGTRVPVAGQQLVAAADVTAFGTAVVDAPAALVAAPPPRGAPPV